MALLTIWLDFTISSGCSVVSPDLFRKAQEIGLVHHVLSGNLDPEMLYSADPQTVLQAAPMQNYQEAPSNLASAEGDTAWGGKEILLQWVVNFDCLHPVSSGEELWKLHGRFTACPQKEDICTL